jgi:hypothetical protein
MRSQVMDTFLYLFDPLSSQFVDLNDDSGGGVNGTDAQISMPQCSSPSGPVLVLANHYLPLTGAYVLTVEFTGPPAASTPLRSRPALKLPSTDELRALFTHGTLLPPRKRLR